MSLEPQGSQSFELPEDAATETTSAAILAEMQAAATSDAVLVSPFGESIVVEPSPRVQVDAVEGLLATDVETYTDGVSGSASVSGQLFVVTTGTSAGGYGTVRTRRQLRYRAGEGMSFKLTGKSSTPAANSLQLFGAFNACDGLFFGYNGTTWGILRRIPGDIGIYRLTLTVPPTGAETATITLNGVAFTMALAAAPSLASACETIANRVGGYTGYLAPTANQATVTWLQTVPATAGGAYTFSSTGTAAGTIATVQAGAPNDIVTGWVPRANWNVDTMPGLDPLNLGPFMFRCGYLGAAPIEAYVMTDTGWRLVHRISYPFVYGVPLFKNPTMRLGWVAASLGSTTNLTVSGASACGEVLGKVLSLRDPTVVEATATATTTETAILSVRVRREFNGRVCSREWMPVHLQAAIETANRLVQVRVYINPTVVGAHEWSYLDQSNSALEVSTAAVTVSASTGRKVASGTVPTGAPLMEPLHELDIRLEPGDVMVVTIDAASNTAVATVSISGLEE